MLCAEVSIKRKRHGSEAFKTVLFQHVTGTTLLVNCSTAAGQQLKCSCHVCSCMQDNTGVDVRRS